MKSSTTRNTMAHTRLLSAMAFTSAAYLAAGCSPEVIVGGATTGGSVDPSTPSSPAQGHTGLCGVTTLASGLNWPGSIAFYGDSVFVVTATGDQVSYGQPPPMPLIQRVPLTGGAPAVVSSVPGTTQRIFASATGLYSTHDDGTLRRTPLLGGAQEILASGGRLPWSVVADATRVYWIDADAVRSAAVTGGPATVLFAATKTADLGQDLVVDETNAYFVTYATDASSGQIMKAPLVPSAATVLVPDLVLPMALALSEGKLYFGDIGPSHSSGEGMIFQSSLDGSTPPMELTSNQKEANGLAINGGKLYWASGLMSPDRQIREPGPISRLTTAQASPGMLPQVVYSPNVAYSIVSCPGGVCWADADAGTVMRFEECSP